MKAPTPNKEFTMSPLKRSAVLTLVILAATQITAQAGEADRNRASARNCRAASLEYNDGDGQRTAHCQMAIYNKCLAQELCDRYPEQCQIFHMQIKSACMNVEGLNGHASQPARCPACE